MKKRLFSLLCALTLLLGAVPSAAALEGESQRAAETLAALHLIDTVPSAKALETSATRTQATELLVRFYGVTAARREVSPQEYAASKGWVTVFSGQKDPIPTEELCASLLRQLGYGVFEGSAALFARRVALTVRDYGETLTLGELYQLTRDALDFPDEEGVSAVDRLIEAGVCTRAEAEAQGLFAQELTARQVADRHMSAVFRLDTYYSEDHYQKGRPDNGGSGFFVSRDGLAVTNYHTIENVVEATATLVTGETYRVERVIFCDPGADLALLQISTTSTEGVETPFFACLELAEDPELRPGDQVYTLGAPLGVSLTISEGIISAINHVNNQFTSPCVINTADISPGSSGGALLNVYGRVVGITTAAYSAGNNLYLSVSLAPILAADWAVPGLPLASVAAAMAATE